MSFSRLAGVAINEWKLPIFEKHLKEKKFSYKVENFSEGVKLLQVEYTSVSLETLFTTLNEAEKECESFGIPQTRH